jgi:hypothetical protein
MTLDYGSFAEASTFIHCAQGAALLILGASEAYALDNAGRKTALIGPLALLAAAAAIPLLMLALPGGWSLGQLRMALEVRRGFHIFLAFAWLFGAAGLSRLTQLLLERRGGGWQALFLFFLAAIGVLYFFMASRVNEEAWRQVLVWHAAAGSTLLLAVLFKSAHVFSRRRFLHVCWSVFLMITALQLLTYRESGGAFGMRLVTLESAPELPAAGPVPPLKTPVSKNAGTTDKKRPGN